MVLYSHDDGDVDEGGDEEDGNGDDGSNIEIRIKLHDAIESADVSDDVAKWNWCTISVLDQIIMEPALNGIFCPSEFVDIDEEAEEEDVEEEDEGIGFKWTNE